MPEPDGERELSTRRDTEHGGTADGQRDAEARPHPPAYDFDEEPLVRSEPLWGKARRILMEPQCLVGQAMRTDDHRGRYVSRLKDTAPLRNQLAITGEHNCLRLLRWDIYRDLPATVVLKHLGD